MAALVLAPSRAPASASDPHWTTRTPPAAGETALDEIEQFVRAVVEQLRPEPAEGADAPRVTRQQSANTQTAGPDATGACPYRWCAGGGGSTHGQVHGGQPRPLG